MLSNKLSLQAESHLEDRKMLAIDVELIPWSYNVDGAWTDAEKYNWDRIHSSLENYLNSLFVTTGDTFELDVMFLDETDGIYDFYIDGTPGNYGYGYNYHGGTNPNGVYIEPCGRVYAHRDLLSEGMSDFEVKQISRLMMEALSVESASEDNPAADSNSTDNLMFVESEGTRLTENQLNEPANNFMDSDQNFTIDLGLRYDVMLKSQGYLDIEYDY